MQKRSFRLAFRPARRRAKMDTLSKIPKKYAEMRVLICGDRNWDDVSLIDTQISRLLCQGKIHKIISGCARGADTLGETVAYKYGIPVERYPADWEKYGKAAGPIRNRQMLDEGEPSLVLAFHDNLEASKGTRDMVGIASRAGIPVRIVSHAGVAEG